MLIGQLQTVKGFNLREKKFKKSKPFEGIVISIC